MDRSTPPETEEHQRPGMRASAAAAELSRERILAARRRGPLGRLLAHARLSGPGWLLGAITLGGGSLAGSLYLGVLTGFSLLWLQLLSMLLGVVMLGAIGYVTLSTGKRPLQAINEHVSPVLGWAWATAALVASLVWCLPQFSLGVAALQQNLVPSLAGPTGRWICSLGLLLGAALVVWFYDRGGRGIRRFETLLKAMVTLIVLSFAGVVAVMSVQGALDWAGVLGGLVPDLSLLWSPAPGFEPHLAAVAPAFEGFWRERIISEQRDVMVTAAATAVGVNMTFLLPYSMLARGWTREHRGLARFDLGFGLLLPFVLATSCVVIAAGARFHGRPDPALIAGDTAVPASLRAGYDALLQARLDAEPGGAVLTSGLTSGLTAERRRQRLAALPAADRRMASMLVRRDAFDLARSLTPLTGGVVAQVVFGVGVLAAAFSTIIILMLISGVVVCEMLGLEARGRPRQLGSLLAGVGVLGPFLWRGEARFWLAVPTSVFAMSLLPIAYSSFFSLMNSKSLLGPDRLRGGRRVVSNALMLGALALAGLGAAWSIWSQARWLGVGAWAALAVVALLWHLRRPAIGPWRSPPR